MLSHQDIHYLTGLLQVVSSPRPVEVELGSMVLDDAAQAERDVDVMVKYRMSDETAAIVVGLEVKDHSRPLDVTHVEQLGAKLADMAAITSRAIVSASGYTEPAIRKAAAHSIRLFELEAWDPEDDVFPARMAQLKTFGERVLTWEELHVSFNLGEFASNEPQPMLDMNARLFDASGAALDGPCDVASLVDVLARKTSAWFADTPEVASLAAGDRRRVRFEARLEERPSVKLDSGVHAILAASIEGSLYWAEHRHPLLYMRLVDVTDGRRPVAGCGLAELSGGELIGITTSAVAAGSVIRVGAEDRKKAVIRRHRLR